MIRKPVSRDPCTNAGRSASARRPGDRVVHVHLKDADAKGNWTKMGTGVIDYAGQFRALDRDGYEGLLSLETHYEVPDGGAEKASRESLAAIRGFCEEAGIRLRD